MHAVAKLARAPSGQFDGNRLPGIGEIVHIYPIGGPFSLARRVPQSLFDRIPWPDAVRPYDKEIKPPRIDARAKFDGIECALLAEKTIRSFDFCCRLERQRGQIGGAVEAFRW